MSFTRSETGTAHGSQAIYSKRQGQQNEKASSANLITHGLSSSVIPNDLDWSLKVISDTRSLPRICLGKYGITGKQQQKEVAHELSFLPRDAVQAVILLRQFSIRMFVFFQPRSVTPNLGSWTHFWNPCYLQSELSYEVRLWDAARCRQLLGHCAKFGS